MLHPSYSQSASELQAWYQVTEPTCEAPTRTASVAAVRATDDAVPLLRPAEPRVGGTWLSTTKCQHLMHLWSRCQHGQEQEEEPCGCIWGRARIMQPRPAEHTIAVTSAAIAATHPESESCARMLPSSNDDCGPFTQTGKREGAQEARRSVWTAGTIPAQLVATKERTIRLLSSKFLAPLCSLRTGLRRAAFVFREKFVLSRLALLL